MSTERTPTAPALPALGEDGWRQARRIALGSIAGLAIAKTMDWPFGVFFAVYPILLLGLLPVFNLKVAAQFVASSVVSIAMAHLLGILGQLGAVAAILAFFIFAARCFALMASGRWFLFGAVSLVSTSVLAHLASYAQTPRSDLYCAQFLATLLAVSISAVMHAFLPERRKVPPQVMDKPTPLVRHQVLLGSICATASYVVFQSIDLSDSLSAQVATVLVLFPMTLAGGRVSAWSRMLGTLFGSAYALALQFVLYAHAPRLPVLLLLYGAGVLFFATVHVRENSGPAVGFAAATAVAVLVGQLSPNADLYSVSLYRFSSVAVASLLMLLCMFAVQALLNRFDATRAPTAPMPPPPQHGAMPGAR